jgi:hypothetical protein
LVAGPYHAFDTNGRNLSSSRGLLPDTDGSIISRFISPNIRSSISFGSRYIAEGLGVGVYVQARSHHEESVATQSRRIHSLFFPSKVMRRVYFVSAGLQEDHRVCL